jgi:hypothetical protein
MKEQYVEDNKPVLAVYPFTKDKQLCFEIKNIGSRKALEVNVDFPKDNILADLKKNLDRFDLKLKNKDIELMPQQSVYYVLEHLSIPQSALETLKHLGAIYLQVSFKDEKELITTPSKLPIRQHLLCITLSKSLKLSFLICIEKFKTL